MVNVLNGTLKFCSGKAEGCFFWKWKEFTKDANRAMTQLISVLSRGLNLL